MQEVIVNYCILVLLHRGSVYEVFSIKQIRTNFILVVVLTVDFKGTLLVDIDDVLTCNLTVEKIAIGSVVMVNLVYFIREIGIVVYLCKLKLHEPLLNYQPQEDEV